MAQVVKQHLVQQEEHETATVAPMLTAPAFSEEQITAFKEESYQQGYAQGAEEARTLAHQELHELEERLMRLLASIPQALEEYRLNQQEELAAISLLIMEHYFAEQSMDTKQLERQINQVLTQLNQQQSIELSLHPDDIKALQNGLIQLKASTKQITIKKDEALALGGFIIKTQHGIFDASVEKQIDKLKTYLINLKQGGLA